MRKSVRAMRAAALLALTLAMFGGPSLAQAPDGQGVAQHGPTDARAANQHAEYQEQSAAQMPPPIPAERQAQAKSAGQRSDTGEQSAEERQAIDRQLVQAAASQARAAWTAAVLGVVSAGLLAWTAIEGRRSANAAIRAVVLANPPRIEVNNIAIYPNGSRTRAVPSLGPGSRFEGVAWMINRGRGTAKILDHRLIVAWLDRLPLIRPYDPPYSEFDPFKIHGLQIDPNDPGKGERGAWDKLTVRSGGIACWRFAEEVPLDLMGSGRSLYVMGAVTFEDEGGQNSVTFCRRFDRKRCQFVPVEGYPEYESGHHS